jgi:hypothetical protein
MTAASAEAYDPAAQLVHADDPAMFAYQPATQLVHDMEAMAPVADRYLPVAQLVHAEFERPLTVE